MSNYQQFLKELVIYPHGDQTDHVPPLGHALMGHFHSPRVPSYAPWVTINPDLYKHLRTVLGKDEFGDEYKRAPHRMPRVKIDGRIIDPRTLGWLAALHDPTPEPMRNRHTSRRWFRRFSSLLSVASDTLEERTEGARARAVEVLSEMIGLQAALDLTAPLPEAPASRWTGSLSDTGVQSYHHMLTRGIVEIPLVPGTKPPPPGAAVYADANGAYRFEAAETQHQTVVGTYIGPGPTPGSMLMRMNMFDTETHAIAPGYHAPNCRCTAAPRFVGEYPAGDAANTLEVAEALARLNPVQVTAPSSGAVLTPDGWRVTCGVCRAQVAEEDMASRELYPVGVCKACYQHDREGVE